MCWNVSYVTGVPVDGLRLKLGQDEAEVLLWTGQRSVVKTTVHLLIAQGEVGWQ